MQSRLHVAMMSSYRECCGISSYTERLVSSIQHGADITLLCNRPHKEVPARSFVNVKERQCFEVTIWSDEVYFDEVTALAAVQEADVLHIQFESALYYQDWMLPFLQAVRGMGIPIVATAHSSCIWPSLPQYITKFLCHSDELCMQLKGIHVHMPIAFQKFTPPYDVKKLVSFGLGRNNDVLVNNAVNMLKIQNPGLTFGAQYGSDHWLSEVELLDYLQSGRATMLLYPHIAALVNSSAVTTALGVCRPVIVTGTSWFSTVIGLFDHEHGFYVANCKESVADAIQRVLRTSDKELKAQYTRRKAVAYEHKMTMDQVGEQHLSIYRELLNVV